MLNVMENGRKKVSPVGLAKLIAISINSRRSNGNRHMGLKVQNTKTTTNQSINIKSPLNQSQLTPTVIPL